MNPHLTPIALGCAAAAKEIPNARTAIAKIDLPGTVHSIGREAFCRSALSEIELPYSLTTIEEKAFYDCKQLKRVTFSPGAVIKEMNKGKIFHGTCGCHITLPEKLEKFEATSLPDGCHVDIADENISFVCDNHFVYSHDRSKLVRCFKGESRMVIPNSIETICDGCFAGCQSVHELVFEEGSQLTGIGKSAFKGLHILELCIPQSLNNFDPRVFHKCEVGTLHFETGSKLRKYCLICCTQPKSLWMMEIRVRFGS